MAASPKIGYSYVRFSTARQALGESEQRQKSAAAAWCEHNGVSLDKTLNLTDVATTAFTGQHRQHPTRYALAMFVQACRDDKIPRDSYLIIENLDRLTREHHRPALQFVFELQDFGIHIVTTKPEKVYRHDSEEISDVMLILCELSRGHGESLRKSGMVGDAWVKRKARSIRNKTALSRTCPHWLTVVIDKVIEVEGKGGLKRREVGHYEEIPERVALVRRIFQEVCDGVGVGALARKLNMEGIPPFRTKRRKRDLEKPHIWQKSSIARILKNRSVVGEYQEMTGHKVRTPVGDPVPDFYPVVITEGQFQTAQLGLKSRLKQGTKARSAGNNLFSGLVKSGAKVPFNLHGKGVGRESLLFRSDTVIGGKNYVGMSYRVFETVILGSLREIAPSDLVAGEGKKEEADKLAEVQGRLIVLENKITDLEEKVYSDPKEDLWFRHLKRAKEEKAEALREMAEARQALATPIVEGVADAHNLIDMLKANPSQELRLKLRAKIATVVSEILLDVYAPTKRYIKVGCAQIRFRNTGYVRNIVFFHQCKRKSRGFFRPETIVASVVNEPAIELAVFADRMMEAQCDMQVLERAKEQGKSSLLKEMQRVAAKYGLPVPVGYNCDSQD